MSLSFEKFVEKISEVFSNRENTYVRNDRENGRYTAKSGEWRVSLGYSGKRIRFYNVRSRENFYLEVAEFC